MHLCFLPVCIIQWMSCAYEGLAPVWEWGGGGVGVGGSNPGKIEIAVCSLGEKV